MKTEYEVTEIFDYVKPVNCDRDLDFIIIITESSPSEYIFESDLKIYSLHLMYILLWFSAFHMSVRG